MPTGKAVLLVEDDLDTRDALRTVLEDAGWSVRVAADGQAALRLLDGYTPDVITLDLMMPRMDGIQFRETQLSDPRLRRIPIVVITGFQAPRSATALLAGVPILRKPLDVAVLLRTLEEQRTRSG